MEKKRENITKNSILIGVVVCIGKVLGFLKQAVIAAAFGATGSTDVYFAADSYTAMFGQIMSQSVSPAMLTQYIKVRKTGGECEAKRLVRDSYLFFFFLGCGIVVLNIIFSAEICNVIGISYSPEQKSMMKRFLICLTPVIVFSACIGVAGGYLDANNRFIPGKIGSLFFSISMITFIVLFYKQLGTWSLVFGFLLGYFLYMVFIIAMASRGGLGRGVPMPFHNPEIRLMLRKFLPLAVGNSIVNLSGQADKIIASSLDKGSVSILYYGQVISYDLVNSVFITSMGTVLLASFSKAVANIDKADGKKGIVENMQGILCSMQFLIGLIVVLYLVEGNDLVKFFFERGNFNAQDTKLVTLVVTCYSLGFVFMAFREIFIKVHYAFSDTFTPMMNSFAGVVINIVSSIALAKVVGVSGIALGTSVSLAIVSVISLFTLKKHIGTIPLKKATVLNLIKIAVSCVISLIVGYMLSGEIEAANDIVELILGSAGILLTYVFCNMALKEDTVLMVIRKIRWRDHDE